MNNRRKMGWTAKGIIGFIFTPMGMLFVLLGCVLWQSKAVSWKHPEDPAIFLAVFGGTGGLFLTAGLILLAADLRRRHLLRRAYYSGNCVEAEIIGISTKNNVNMVNGHPCTVECAWTDSSGTAHIYHSRYLYTDVTKLLKTKTVPVYIDRYNENIGFVDIDAVLPEIRIHP